MSGRAMVVVGAAKGGRASVGEGERAMSKLEFLAVFAGFVLGFLAGLFVPRSGTDAPAKPAKVVESEAMSEMWLRKMQACAVRAAMRRHPPAAKDG